MQRTTNYNFKKPDYTDAIDVKDFNDNADAIDAKLKELEANPYVSVKCDTFGYTAPLYDLTINGTAATNTEAASYLAANRNAIIKLTIVNDNVTAEFRYSTTFDGADFYMAYGFENTIWEMVIEEISGDKYLSTSFYEYENPELKVTSISASSTDAQYPSAKAVYTALQGAGGTTIIGCETPSFIQGATLSNFTIDGEIATEEEVGSAAFESNRVEFHVTETNVDGAGKHGLQVLRLNDRYGDETVSFYNYGYGSHYLVVIDKIDEFTYDVQLVVQ